MKLIHYAAYSVAIVSIISVLSTVCSLAIMYQQGYRLMSVQSNSMVPLFQKGDAIIIRQANAAEIQVGDIVSYRSPANSKIVVSHRVMSRDVVTGKIITKGDNVAFSDIAFPSQNLVGKTVQTVPYLGYGIDWLRQPSGLIVLLYTPAAFLLVSEVRRLARVYQKTGYVLYGQ